MDFQSAMETFAEAWVAANTQTALTEAAEAQQLHVDAGNVPHQVPCDERGAPEAVGNDSGPDTDRSNRGHWYRHRHAAEDHHQPAHRHHQQPCSSPGTGKSIPVHCVVRAPLACCQQQQQRQQRHHRRRHDSRSESEDDSDSTAAAADQVHSPCRHAHVELDSYVIIPSGTLLSELVRTALVKLGYTAPEARGARGAIRIRNWKSLPLDAITDDAEARVGDILGELTAVATLRIRLRSRSEISSASDVKEKLLQLLLTQSQSLLASAGCPIDEKQLALISKGSWPSELPEDTRRRFDQWYLQQVVDQRARLRQTHNHNRSQVAGPAAGAGTDAECRDSAGTVPRAVVDGGETGTVHKTRMRTSFDPELELPQLHQWFSKNQHPTRLQIQSYVRDLNGLESRRGRRMLTEQNVLYWFKNARAACKRAEMRHVNGSSPGVQDHDSAASNDSCRPIAQPEPLAPKQGTERQDERATTSAAGAMDLTVNHPTPCDRRDPPPPPPLPPPPTTTTTTTTPSNGHWQPPLQLQAPVSVKSEPGTEEKRRVEEGDCDCECECGDQTGANSASMSPIAGDKSPQMTRSMIYMASYLPAAAAAAAINALDERRKRNRTFIDPVTEVPRLEQWFSCNTHPSHNLIVKYTEELNRMPYRQKFPRLESKNVQFWFKNRRAKSKRLRVCSS